MNFYKTLGLKNSRIDVADALRGLGAAHVLFKYLAQVSFP